MNAVVKEEADWREVFNAEFRAIQAQYPAAHEALKNWGRWSHELHGVYPSVSRPGWTDFYKPNGDGYADDLDLENATRAANPASLFKNDPPERPKSDERSGVELDIRIHATNFPPIWRRVLRAAYFTIEIPEYECPRAARVGSQGYLTFLDGALAFLERTLSR